jgi:hypothetical protein
MDNIWPSVSTGLIYGHPLIVQLGGPTRRGNVDAPSSHDPSVGCGSTVVRSPMSLPDNKFCFSLHGVITELGLRIGKIITQLLL